ncbi:MAG: hypothetical protein U1F83_03575 [Verrucomicrobiota bacterium]
MIVEVNDASVKWRSGNTTPATSTTLSCRNQQASASQARLDLMQAQAQSRADRERVR